MKLTIIAKGAYSIDWPEIEIIKMMCEAFYNPSSIKQLRILDSGDH
jgi:hypothetical protein